MHAHLLVGLEALIFVYGFVYVPVLSVWAVIALVRQPYMHSSGWALTDSWERMQ